MPGTIRKLAEPKERAKVQIPLLEVTMYDGTRVSAPAYTLEVAEYPTYEDGSEPVNLTQAQVAKLLAGTGYRLPTLREDEAMRDQLGKEHSIFDPNFERNGKEWRSGYVADFTRPSTLGEVAGINGQKLVTRELGYRLPTGDVMLGTVTMAPDGMVPTLTKVQLQKFIGEDELKILGELRRRKITETDDQIVDVRDPLGYAQLTLDHDKEGDNRYILPHNAHFYRPEQNDKETIVLRAAAWRHDGRGCFYVDLSIGVGSSRLGRSFHPVRGGSVKVSVVGPTQEFNL